MWYKVIIRRDGSVTSCEEVSGSFDDGASVFFVEADTKTDAILAAILI